ncbi:MAG: DUF418 domain-containing protein [Sphingomonas sp.]|uniref:DUF418 domain-containing protein n=1 Tax=Sphingomonas sp. TaxID=28214 RepID=UPI00260C6358|nr:DUF418 domain-containing protein [Sphingomonas sp.]MDK2770505.1 DUF418 domain-containing protein [Sphingomonas sp.]
MTSGRNHSVDVVRLAALIGICVVNIPFMGLATAPAVPAGAFDQIVMFAVNALCQAKFFLLFSFIFGWGFEIQERSAARAGADFPRRYGRRLIGLAILGCLHAILVFSGDILLIYAILGLLLWPLRRLESRTLWRVALCLVPIATVGMMLLALAWPEVLPRSAGSGLGGSFLDSSRARLADWPSTLGFLLFFQGPLAFAAFVAGLAAAKADFFASGGQARYRLGKATPWLFVVAITLNAFYAATDGGWLWSDDGSLALSGLCALSLGAPMMAAVYLSAILSLSERMRLPPLLVLAGRNSLTSYVLQGVLAGFLFGGYGLGLFGQFGHQALFGLSILVAFVAMLMTGLAASYLGRAPLESLLRLVTHGRQQNSSG